MTIKTITQETTIRGTAAERAAMTTTDFAGNHSVRFIESDTGNEYKFDGDSWVQTRSGGAALVSVGGPGGDGAVTTLETFLVAGGASQTGTAVAMPSGRCVFQAVANGTSGAFAATVTILGSLDGDNFETLGTITLSGTATTADSDGFAIDAPWAWVRADVSGFSGTGATCAVYKGA